MLPSASVRAYVLAGGRSSRMGRDKAALPWGAGSLLAHAVSLASQSFSEVVVVAKAMQILPSDLPPGLGRIDDAAAAPDAAIAGLMAALTHLAANPAPGPAPEKAFLFATDMPLVPPQLLAHVAARAAAASAAHAVVPSWRGRLQPTVAVYDVRLLAFVAGSCERGEYRLLPLPSGTVTIEIPGEELAPFVPAGLDDPFANINTPSEYDRLAPRRNR